MPKTWRVLISAPYMQPVIDRFRDEMEKHDIEIVLPDVEERLSEDELLEYISDIDGVICGDDRFTERVLDSAPRLKVISKWGTGIDSIDSDACAERGIPVYNTPDAFSDAVADTAMGFILCFARNIVKTNEAMHEGSWKKIQGHALHECTLGIIGVGNVGKTTARRAEAFDCRVLGHDLVDMPPDFIEETGIEMTSKNTVLAESDYVSLHCDLNPTSRHLIGSAELSSMKSSAILVNTSRGPVIDEQALVAALREPEIAGAALDVFEDEPLPQDSPLRKMDNVLLSPHNANSSPDAWERVHRNTLNNLIKGLEGGHQ